MTLPLQDAADIVLVVDESGSMNREHEWLLIMIPKLEQALVEAGEYITAKIKERVVLALAMCIVTPSTHVTMSCNYRSPPTVLCLSLPLTPVLNGNS